ncbi:DUF5709 domain-containing protein [Geodermatophilus sp. SYSU D00815]
MGGYRGDDETDAQEASGLLEPEDVLEDDGYGDVLDRGYSPRDTPVASTDFGMTEAEEEAGESLDGRLARELPDRAAEDDGFDDGLGDVVGTDGELRDDEVGGDRAGRLSAGDDGYGDTESELWAEDEGIDGAGASAEEAAVHVVGDDDRP